MQDLGFRVTEDIQDEEGTVYAAWMRRKPTVHDTAMTGGDGPRMHHIAFATHEKHNILAICDKLGALRRSDAIERGPGRHGVSNAFYLYLRDPDGHRVEIYTQDYYTGDPDNPVVTWDVHDNQRRDWWGNPVVPSWYTEASLVLDLDGNPQPVVARTDTSEMAVTIGADGFSYTRPDDAPRSCRAGSRASTSWATSCDRATRRRTDAADRSIAASPTSSPRPSAPHGVIPRITARYPEATVEDSYAIQGVWRDTEPRRRAPARRPQDRADLEGDAGRRPASPSPTTASCSTTPSGESGVDDPGRLCSRTCASRSSSRSC